MRASVHRFTRDAARYDTWYQTPWGSYAEQEQWRLVLEMARPQPGESVLDVGCGTGRMLLRMLQRGLDARGVEPAPEMRAFSQLRLEKAGHRPGRVIAATAEALPFDDASFDLVCAITVLEFVDDVAQALQEMRRVCNGRFFIGALNARSAYAARIARGEAGETLSRARLLTPSDLVKLANEQLQPRRIRLETALVGGLTQHPLELAVQRTLDLRLRSVRYAAGGFIALLAEVQH